MGSIKIFVLISVIVFCVMAPFQAIATTETSQDRPDRKTSEVESPEPGALVPEVESTGEFVPDDLLYVPDLSEDQQFLPLSIENGLSPVWVEFSRNLDNEVVKDKPARIAVDPVFGSGFDILSQFADSSLFTDIEIPDPSDVLVLSAKRNFKLTRQVLDQLKREGVPDEVLEDLKLLEKQGFLNEALFLNTVEAYIGAEQTFRYKASILKYASADYSASPGGLIKVSQGTHFWDITFDPTQNVESWESVFYYSKKFKKSVSSNDRKRLKILSRKSDEERDLIFDILEFFRKWGIPAPLTIVLCAIAIYLALAFLSRE